VAYLYITVVIILNNNKFYFRGSFLLAVSVFSCMKNFIKRIAQKEKEIKNCCNDENNFEMNEHSTHCFSELPFLLLIENKTKNRNPIEMI
jgi:hypothetical protein